MALFREIFVFDTSHVHRHVEPSEAVTIIKEQLNESNEPLEAIEAVWQEIQESQQQKEERNADTPWGIDESEARRTPKPLAWRPPVMKPEYFYGETDTEWRASHRKRLETGTQLVLTTQKRSLRHVFRKQDLAFHFADEANSAVYPPQPRHCPVWRVFAFERRIPFEDPSLAQGARSYVAASLREFWEVYSHLAENARHFYEVIRQGMPCKLYFDLEYNRTINVNLDGDKVMDFFTRRLLEYISTALSRVVSELDLIELDATTESKFSRHLIVKDVVFESNIIAGHFVRQFVTSAYQKFIVETTRAAETAETTSTTTSGDESEYAQMFPFSDAGTASRTSLVDLGVYTKNRNFRIYLSTKLSKNAPLHLSTTCKYSYCGNQEGLFLDSLASFVPADAKPGTFAAIPASLEAMSQGESYVASASTHDPTDHGPSITASSSAVSPFPELDAHIKQILDSRPGHRGFIRGWLLYESSSLLVYQIGGNRYCERIKREHKSNHIAIAVDLNLCVWYQRCLDPECRAGSFKSEPRPIPPHIICPLIGEGMLDLEVDMALREAEHDGTLLSEDVLAALELP